jgi:hypothetical protein
MEEVERNHCQKVAQDYLGKENGSDVSTLASLIAQERDSARESVKRHIGIFTCEGYQCRVMDCEFEIWGFLPTGNMGWTRVGRSLSELQYALCRDEMKREQIAKLFGITQAAVSYRLLRTTG